MRKTRAPSDAAERVLRRDLARLPETEKVLSLWAEVGGKGRQTLGQRSQNGKGGGVGVVPELQKRELGCFAAVEVDVQPDVQRRGRRPNLGTNALSTTLCERNKPSERREGGSKPGKANSCYSFVNELLLPRV